MFWTVIGGLFLFLIGQIMIRYVLDPLTHYRKLVGEIAHVLYYYANVYMSSDPNRPKETGDRVADALREKASLLFAVTHPILLYGFLAWLRLVPSKDSIREAWKALTYLSNSIYDGEPKYKREAREKILDALSIPDWR